MNLTCFTIVGLHVSWTTLLPFCLFILVLKFYFWIYKKVQIQSWLCILWKRNLWMRLTIFEFIPYCTIIHILNWWYMFNIFLTFEAMFSISIIIQHVFLHFFIKYPWNQVCQYHAGKMRSLCRLCRIIFVVFFVYYPLVYPYLLVLWWNERHFCLLKCIAKKGMCHLKSRRWGL